MRSITDILHQTVLQKYAGDASRLHPSPKHISNALSLLSLESPRELCRFLNTSIYPLEKIINSPEYNHYILPKKRGGERQIFAPEKQLKLIQKRLNYYLQAYYLWIKPVEVHGFVINPHYLGAHCNIVANANVHTGKKHVLNIDLEDFFPSIPAKRIKNLFTSPYFNFNEQIAIALTLLTTYEGKLPAGAPTSPVLSNFICLDLDADLRIFCHENGLQFTRYADDLTFSSDTLISADTVLNIILLIVKNGFNINNRKLRLQASNRKQTVTGLTVNEKVNVDRKLLKKIRAMLHDLATNGIEAATRRHFQLEYVVDSKLREAIRKAYVYLPAFNPEDAVDSKLQYHFINRLKGYINFVGQVRGKDDPVYRKFKQLFDVRFV